MKTSKVSDKTERKKMNEIWTTGKKKVRRKEQKKRKYNRR